MSITPRPARRWPLQFKIAGAALQPFRDTRPLLQDGAVTCRSGLVSRKGRKATPASPSRTPILNTLKGLVLKPKWWSPNPSLFCICRYRFLDSGKAIKLHTWR
ncbi:hypothetical protein DMX06_01060 [Pseudomonas mosselii]|nr:hypothetical protein DMX06_01060 [Pseudomonas mosselii]